MHSSAIRLPPRAPALASQLHARLPPRADGVSRGARRTAGPPRRCRLADSRGPERRTLGTDAAARLVVLHASVFMPLAGHTSWPVGC